MELIQHTENWVKGELIESIATGCVGLILLVATFLFWKYGSTPYARAMILPLLVVGIIPFVAGISGSYTNANRMTVYEQHWQADKKSFIASEKERVKGFDNIFKYTYPMAIIFTIGGALLFFAFGSLTIKSISLALILMGGMAYFIDHFAAQRASVYLAHIEKAEQTIKRED